MSSETNPPGRTWHLSSELPDNVYSVMRKSDLAISPIAVVATVDQDGAPHTAPFASLRAVTPSLLRLICFRYHHTYSNLIRDGRVMVSFLAPPDIAVSIRGKTTLVKEQMAADENYAILEMQVEEVKNDMVKTVVIESPITVAPQFAYEDWFDTALSELENIE